MSRKTVDLKPCPFCGSTAEGHIETQGSKWGAIVCGACAAQGPEVRTVYQSWPKWREDAAVEWNTRPASDARAPSRILHHVPGLPARSGDDVRWVRALLKESNSAYLSSLRAKTYAKKPTTSSAEACVQTELYQRHLVRQERVVLAFVEALRGRP